METIINILRFTISLYVRKYFKCDQIEIVAAVSLVYTKMSQNLSKLPELHPYNTNLIENLFDLNWK